MSIAKKKNIFFGDVHLNNEDGELCMIHPLQIKDRYPKGFDLEEFLHHLEEHLYWVSYFDKYNKKPWDDLRHGELGYVDLYSINKKYLPDIQKSLDPKHKVSRKKFEKIIIKNQKDKNNDK